MNAGHDEFFAVIGEGAELLAALDENSAGFFDSLNRLREILAMIGDLPAPALTPEQPASVQFSLADKAASAASLRAYLDTGLSALPPELAVYEADTVSSLANLADDGRLYMDAQNWAAGQQGPQAHTAEAKIAAYDNLAARGLGHGMDHPALKAAVDEAETVRKLNNSDDPGYVAARAEYDAVTDKRRARMNEIAKVLDKATGDERAALSAEYQVLLDDPEQEVVYLKLRASITAFDEARAQRVRELLDDNGAAIIAKIAAASPISEEASLAWANEQIIDDNARAKLKRLKYSPDDAIRDMAEFYRLTGGKASAIRLSSGRGRANAVGIDTRTGEKVINLGSRFNKTVLFHELAHHLENDPIAKAASNGFLLKRRESDAVYRLRDLTGNKGYDRSEVAYKDGFMDEYIGKVYAGGITEVWSMGVQYLADPKEAAQFAAKDPEMFNLVTGYLGMATTPAMYAKLNMHKGLVSDALEKKKNAEDQYADAIEWLAQRAPLVKDDWYERLAQDGSESAFSERGFIAQIVTRRDKKRDPQYVGLCGGKYRVFSGTFRNTSTKRYGKGFLFVEFRENATPDYDSLNGTIQDVQAFCAIAIINGADTWNTYLKYFAYRDGAKNVLELVEGLK